MQLMWCTAYMMWLMYICTTGCVSCWYNGTACQWHNKAALTGHKVSGAWATTASAQAGHLLPREGALSQAGLPLHAAGLIDMATEVAQLGWVHAAFDVSPAWLCTVSKEWHCTGMAYKNHNNHADNNRNNINNDNSIKTMTRHQVQ